MDDQIRIRVRTFSLPERYAGCLIEAVPFALARGRDRARFRAGICIRNLARYIGLTQVALFRAVRLEFGSHYLHMIRAGENNKAETMGFEEFEQRIGYVCLRLAKRVRENLDYREAVDSLVEKYELPPWRIFIGMEGDDMDGTYACRAEPGEISLFVDPGRFRD